MKSIAIYRHLRGARVYVEWSYQGAVFAARGKLTTISERGIGIAGAITTRLLPMWAIRRVERIADTGCVKS